MAKLQIIAGEAFQLRLSRLAGDTKSIVEKAVYEAADIAADALRSEIEALPVEDERSTTRRGVTKEERQDLLNNMGVSSMRIDGGSVNVKTGFDGYGHRTKRHPQGLPVIKLARSIQSGTSFRVPNRFSSRATSRAKGPAVAKMNEIISQEINKRMKG